MKRIIIFSMLLTACRGEYDASDEGVSESDEDDSSDMGDSNCGSACETGGSTSTDGSSDSDSTSTTGDDTGNTDDTSDSVSTTTTGETGAEEETTEGSSETGQVDLPKGAYCNPWLDTCENGLACHRHGAPAQNGKYFFWCIESLGDVLEGEECISTTDCIQGYECMSNFILPDALCEFNFCCSPLCALPDGPSCPNGYPKCQIMNLEFLNEYPFEEVGHCRE